MRLQLYPDMDLHNCAMFFAVQPHLSGKAAQDAMLLHVDPFARQEGSYLSNLCISFKPSLEPLVVG